MVCTKKEYFYTKLIPADAATQANVIMLAAGIIPAIVIKQANVIIQADVIIQAHDIIQAIQKEGPPLSINSVRLNLMAMKSL